MTYSRDINSTTDDKIPKDNCDSPDAKLVGLFVLLLCDIIDPANRITRPGVVL